MRVNKGVRSEFERMLQQKYKFGLYIPRSEKSENNTENVSKLRDDLMDMFAGPLWEEETYGFKRKSG